jgi:outer membrane protein TolC
MLAIAGCAVGPKFERPDVPLREEWSERDTTLTTDAPPDSAWWRAFNDPTLRIKNNVRVQDARLQQLLIEYQNIVLEAAQEVEDGMIGFLRARDAAAFAADAATDAQRSVDLAFVQYREGAVDFQRVLDAQRSLLQEQNSVAETRSSVATNLIAL